MMESKKIKPETFHVPEEVIREHIEQLCDELMKKRKAVSPPQPSRRTRMKAEAKGTWNRLKQGTKEAIEPLWDRKEEIILTVATKLIKGWIGRKLGKG